MEERAGFVDKNKEEVEEEEEGMHLKNVERKVTT